MSANRARCRSVIVEILYFSGYRTRLISEPSGRRHVRRLVARLRRFDPSSARFSYSPTNRRTLPA